MQDNIFNISIYDLQNKMRERKISSLELTGYYLKRIQHIDKCRDGLNSVIEINPDAMKIAQDSDMLRMRGNDLGELHGIPILIKDNISTGDKMKTSAGSMALSNNTCGYDSGIAKQLRNSGAVILGKTNMTEFANFMSDNMPNGYSSRGGQTINPLNKNIDPSGSSTGSAVAVRSNLCMAAIGTETFGSIISPSQSCGVIGLKPTAGLINTNGIIPISHTFDTAGPITRSVSDAAVILECLTHNKYSNYITNNINQFALKDFRVGICRLFCEETNIEWLENTENLIKIITYYGADCLELPDHNIRLSGIVYPIMKCEFKRGINLYLNTVKNDDVPKNLSEIIEYNNKNPEKCLKYGQNILIDCNDNTTGDLSESEYITALSARDEIINKFDRIFVDNKLDVIFFTAGNSGIPAFTGFPSMTIPLEYTKEKLPISSFFAARRNHEGNLFRIASFLESEYCFK